MKYRFPKNNLQCSIGGFTIIETLVAVTVLMIAIAGPLVVASKGLFGALASKDQMIATYLAQESMETIKNVRDNNIATGATWDQISSSLGTMDQNCVSGSSGDCDASAVDTQQIIDNCSGPCPIYLEPSGVYGHSSSGSNGTLFTRHFLFTVPSLSDPNDAIITVYVQWYEGTVPYEVSLSSELTNSTR